MDDENIENDELFADMVYSNDFEKAMENIPDRDEVIFSAFDNPWWIAHNSGNKELLEAVEQEGWSYESRDMNGNHYLHEMLSDDYIDKDMSGITVEVLREVAKHFYREDLDDFDRGREPKPPILRVLECGRTDLAEVLAEEGASMDRNLHDKQSLIEYFIYHENDKISSWLVGEMKVDLEECSFSEGFVPLHEAISAKMPLTAIALIENLDDLELNSEDEENNSLHVACADDGNEEIIRAICKKDKSQMATKDYYDSNPLACATEDNRMSYCKILIEEFGQSPNDPLGNEAAYWVAIKRDNIEMLKYFLEQDPNIIEPKYDEESTTTPLLIAAALTSKNEEVITLLIDHGATIDAVSEDRSVLDHFLQRDILSGKDSDFLIEKLVKKVDCLSSLKRGERDYGLSIGLPDAPLEKIIKVLKDGGFDIQAECSRDEDPITLHMDEKDYKNVMIITSFISELPEKHKELAKELILVNEIEAAATLFANGLAERTSEIHNMVQNLGEEVSDKFYEIAGRANDFTSALMDSDVLYLRKEIEENIENVPQLINNQPTINLLAEKGFTHEAKKLIEAEFKVDIEGLARSRNTCGFAMENIKQLMKLHEKKNPPSINKNQIQKS